MSMPSEPPYVGSEPPFGQQTYGHGYPPHPGYEHPQGTTILILGILSLVMCQLLGPVAWVMGNSAIKEIDANPSAYSNRSMVQAGRVCGIICTALIGLFIAFALLMFLLAGLAAASLN